MKIGYARVSTEEQYLDLQIDALNAARCEKIFTDEGISGITIERAGLSQALSAMGKEDILVVWKLDRLGRSLGFLCELIERLKGQGAEPDRWHRHDDDRRQAGLSYYERTG